MYKLLKVRQFICYLRFSLCVNIYQFGAEEHLDSSCIVYVCKNSSAVQMIRYANTSQTKTKDKCFEKSRAYDNIELRREGYATSYDLRRKHFYACGINVYIQIITNAC